jgi:AcrR family transcriptional regulator
LLTDQLVCKIDTGGSAALEIQPQAVSSVSKGEARREAILRAALELVREHGAHALTLDAVARHAGVSKGGLIHHFNTKEALVRGVIDASTAALHRQIESAYHASPDRSPGSFTRVYVETTLRHASEGYLLPLFELVARDPGMAGTLADHNAWCHKRLENDDIDPVLAHVIASAADGLWVEIIFRLESTNSWRVRAMRAWLLEMSRKPVAD